MSVCPPYRDTLILDILAELDPRRQDEWQQHLAGCPGCRAEKEAARNALDLARTAYEPPSLGDADAAVMRRQVIQTLTGKSKSRSPQKLFFLSRGFVSAFAATCVLLIMIGFGTFDLFDRPATNQDTSLALIQEQVPADEIAIITHMDLLNNLDALNKIAKVVDQSDTAPTYNNVQGKYGYGEKTTLS